MASIRDLGNGKFKITVSKGRVDGKQKLVSTTYKAETFTEKGKPRSADDIRGDAEEYAKIFEKEVHEGKHSQDSRLTFEKYIKIWVEGYGKQRLEQHTLEDYLNVLRLHITPHIGGLRMGKITTHHINEILTIAYNNGKAPSTIKRIFCVCNSVFRYAYTKDAVTSNPCNRGKIDLPQVKSNEIDLSEKNQEHALSVEQTNRFLQFCRNPYTVEYHRKNGMVCLEQRTIPLQMQLYYHLAFLTGARRGELIALRWNDLDWNTQTLSINKATSLTKDGQIIKSPKTASGRRKLEVTALCIDLLHRWHSEAMKRSLSPKVEWKGYRGQDFDRNYIFIQSDGSQMSLWTPYQSLQNAIRQFNKSVDESERIPNIRLHDARHTCASMQIALGISMADTSRNLGHASVDITNRIYIHGEESAPKKARIALQKVIG